MNKDNYIALLECAVLSLLNERWYDNKSDFDSITIPKGISEHPSFKTGGSFSPYNLKQTIEEARKNVL